MTSNKSNGNEATNEATNEAKTKPLTMIEILSAEEKVDIIIDPRSGDIWEGSINGVPISLATGKQISVPKSVAELISNNNCVIREASESVKSFIQGAGLCVHKE